MTQTQSRSRRGNTGTRSFNRSNANRSRYNQPKRRSGGRTGAYIDPQKFINRATPIAEEVEFIPTHSFAEFNFSPSLARNITSRGYSSLTPIQDGAIGPILEGRDMIGLANTGTGKTAAFILPIIAQLQKAPNQSQVLIMAPTRELAVQIDEEFRAFARGLQLYSCLCVGGVSPHRQIIALSRRPQVVVGTPGRLKDLVMQGALKLERTNILVLDEADRMLDMGFIADIRFLLGRLPKQRQSLCFSATITSDVNRLLSELLIDPVTVSVVTRETSDHVEQDVVRADSQDHKLELLMDMLRQPEFDKVLIFGGTKWSVQRLAEKLSQQGLPAEAIHGNKSQAQRQRALSAFKDNRTKVLVATDVAARGLDIPNVSHVINFDQPNSYQDYVHRIGRTGRAGKRGQALTFIGSR